VPKKAQPTQKTPKGYEIPARDREAVLSDFRKIVGPRKGQRRAKK
jgi:hypothetical protein